MSMYMRAALAAKKFLTNKKNYNILDDCTNYVNPFFVAEDGDGELHMVTFVIGDEDFFDEEYISRSSLEKQAIHWLMQSAKDLDAEIVSIHLDVLNMCFLNKNRAFLRYVSDWNEDVE